jgi:predicted nucleic acid-binding protein
VKYLLDTNVFSELRPRPNRHPGVLAWLAAVSEEDLFTSVLVLGEIRRGIEKVRVSDAAFASRLEAWLVALKADYADRALPIDSAVADVWGTFDRRQLPPEPDGLIAATALRYGMILVTRNVDHVAGTGVATLNPWAWG